MKIAFLILGILINILAAVTNYLIGNKFAGVMFAATAIIWCLMLKQGLEDL